MGGASRRWREALLFFANLLTNQKMYYE